MNVTTNLDPGPRLRMNGAVPVFPQDASMTWTGRTSLPPGTEGVFNS